MDAKYNELLSIAQRAEAHLAYMLDLPTIQVQIGDGGLSSLTNGNRQAAHRWEFKEVQEMLENKGCEALEEMLELRMEIEELKMEPPDSSGRAAMEQRLQRRREAMLKEVEGDFAKLESGALRDELLRSIRRRLNALKYVQNLLRDLKSD